MDIAEGKQGLWANIHAKRKRIKAGSGERMRRPGEKGRPTEADFKAANEEMDVKDTDDYKLSKSGRKVKAHKIIFNKGEDDGKKGVTEQMKKSFSQFVQEHTPELTEEQLNELVAELQEVLGKDDPAGEWISDFVHSDNPKFAGKSKEKRKQMALAAYYAKQRDEEVEIEQELKGNQHKLDKNKNGKLDKHDFKLLRKEDAEQVNEKAKWRSSSAAEANPEHDPEEYAHDKLSTGSPIRSKADKPLPYGSIQSRRGTEVASSGPRKGMVTKKSAESLKNRMKANLNKEEVEQVDEAWPGTPEYKKKFPDTERTTGAGARHDIKKTATGVIATRRFADNDEAEKPKDAPKRGRGRPKKDKFAEAVEFLMGLDEEAFDSLMEEGFDSFMEHFEQLDELSKTTLGSYARKAAASAVSHTTKAQQSKAHAQDAMKRAKDPKLAFARSDNEKLAKSYTKSSEKSSDKASKRLFGVNRALSRLTK